MKVKVIDLSGPALDFAVEMVRGRFDEYAPHDPVLFFQTRRMLGDMKPSVDWGQGGPIIERENICLVFIRGKCGAYHCLDGVVTKAEGPSVLIAAMRCYLLLKVGEEIEVPDELVKKPVQDEVTL